ncbi:MAG TPA: ankyrin repeat domain-containing protein, partial [Campylobacterales bacterium]|nr:ankyrin repeat domain-containing protein [Campylobacterales bacterium]
MKLSFFKFVIAILLLPSFSFANVDENLLIATRHGEIDKVKLLLKQGANPNKTDIDGNTLLHLTALFTNTDMIELLLNSGADINKQNLDGRTPLFNAIYLGK